MFQTYSKNPKTEEFNILPLWIMLQNYKRSYGTNNALGVVQADFFNKFKDTEGKFNPSLANDIQGLLSLYEAAQLKQFDYYLITN